MFNNLLNLWILENNYDPVLDEEFPTEMKKYSDLIVLSINEDLSNLMVYGKCGMVLHV